MLLIVEEWTRLIKTDRSSVNVMEEGGGADKESVPVLDNTGEDKDNPPVLNDSDQDVEDAAVLDKKAILECHIARVN